jgi:hypothetical protein
MPSDFVVLNSEEKLEISFYVMKSILLPYSLCCRTGSYGKRRDLDLEHGKTRHEMPHIRTQQNRVFGKPMVLLHQFRNPSFPSVPLFRYALLFFSSLFFFF